MTFRLPDNTQDAAMFKKVLGIVQHFPAGRAMLEDLRLAYRQGANPIDLHVDAQMSEQFGNCRKNDKVTSICLAANLSRAQMHSVLAHELRHCRQVPARNTLKGEAFRQFAHFTIRLREGDAFAHQFAVAMDTADHRLIDAAFGFLSRGRDDWRRDLVAIADAWVDATAPDARQAVMSRLFWHVQDTLLTAYADQHEQNLRQLIGNRGEAQLREGLDRLPEVCLQHLLENMTLPAIVPGLRDGCYLGTDFEGLRDRLLAMAPPSVSVTSKLTVSKTRAPC